MLQGRYVQIVVERQQRERDLREAAKEETPKRGGHAHSASRASVGGSGKADDAAAAAAQRGVDGHPSRKRQ